MALRFPTFPNGPRCASHRSCRAERAEYAITTSIIEQACSVATICLKGSAAPRTNRLRRSSSHSARMPASSTTQASTTTTSISGNESNPMAAATASGQAEEDHRGSRLRAKMKEDFTQAGGQFRSGWYNGRQRDWRRSSSQRPTEDGEAPLSTVRRRSSAAMCGSTLLYRLSQPAARPQGVPETSS